MLCYAKSLQSCPTVRPHRRQPTRLPHPWDSPGKNTGVGCHFLLQCVKVKVKSLSPVQLLATPWTAAHQAPQSMGFSRQEYWSGLPLPSPILYIVVYICQLQSPNLFLPSLFPGNHKFVFYSNWEKRVSELTTEGFNLV